jgi:ribulose-phosphate 3-epimerase
MAEIIPAILPQSLADLEEKLSLVDNYVSTVQIDVTDGKFVQSKSWPYYNNGYDGYFLSILKEEAGLPLWEKMDYEIDLMVKNPELVVDDWIKAGARRIIIHVESTMDIKEVMKNLNDKYSSIKNILVGVDFGVAINISTSNDVVYDLLNTLDSQGMPLADFVQFMGIDKIGFQGESLDDKVFDKIKELRNKFPDTIISIDGGVTTENAEALVHAGVNRVVSGSAIFESDNPMETLDYFKSL